MSSTFRFAGQGAVLALIVLVLQFVFGFVAPLAAQEAAPTAPPAKVQQLIELLDDPDVRQWLAAKQTTPPPQAATPPSGVASQWVAQIRGHLTGLRDATPRLVPEWMAARERIASEMHEGSMPILRGFGFVLIVGYGAEFLLRYLLRRSANRSAVEPGYGLAAFVRIAPLVVFAIAAIAAFVLADWPRRLEAAVAPLLIAWIVARLLIAVAAAMTEPAEENADGAETAVAGPSPAPDVARFWHRRFVLIVCAAAALWAVMDMMQALSFPADVRDLTGAALGLVVLGIGIETVLRRPAPDIAVGRRILRNALLIAFLILLWVVWVAGMKVLFWLGVYVLGLPPLLRMHMVAA